MNNSPLKKKTKKRFPNDPVQYSANAFRYHNFHPSPILSRLIIRPL